MSDICYTLLNMVLVPPISGKRPSGGVSSDTEGIPSIGGENILVNGGMTYEELKKIPVYFFRNMPKGKLLRHDVLINKDGAQTGKVGLYRGEFDEAAVNEHVFILRARDQRELDQYYLYFCVLLPETRNKIERRITGSAQPGLNSLFVKTVDIPLCSIGKQQKIAAILTSIDTTIEKTESLIAKYQKIKAGLMHDLFTRGVTADGKLRTPREQAPELYQETPVGWIPVEWDMEILREVCFEISDGAHYSVNRCEEGVPFLFVSCIRNGQILWDVAARISSETYEEISKKSKPYKGMILFTVVGSYGHAAYVPTNDPFGFERNIAYIKPKTDIVEPKFLYYWLTSSCVKNQIEHLVVGNAQKVLTLGNIGKVTVALQKEDEQKSTVAKLESIDEMLSCEQRKLNKFISVKLGLMHDLLSGKVPVKIDKPGKEPA